jgi:hypothetical protein
MARVRCISTVDWQYIEQGGNYWSSEIRSFPNWTRGIDSLKKALENKARSTYGAYNPKVRITNYSNGDCFEEKANVGW